MAPVRRPRTKYTNFIDNVFNGTCREDLKENRQANGTERRPADDLTRHDTNVLSEEEAGTSIDLWTSRYEMAPHGMLAWFCATSLMKLKNATKRNSVQLNVVKFDILSPWIPVYCLSFNNST